MQAAVFVLFACLLGWLVSRHVVWRDEVRAYSIARSAGSPLSLVRDSLSNEGHPPLWYLILWAGARATDEPAILKVAAFAASLGFSSLFFFAAPFPLWHRVCFLSGILALNVHSVVSRNYGIADLFLFLLAMEFSRPGGGRAWRCGLYNFLLAITNLYGTICAASFLLVPPVPEGGPTGESRRRWSVIALWTLAGWLLAAYTVWPDRENMIIGRSTFSTESVAQDLLDTVLDRDLWSVFHLSGYRHAGRIRETLGASPAAVLGVACQGCICLALWRRRWALASYLAALLPAGLLSARLYQAGDRQIGVITIHLLALLWISRRRDPAKTSAHWTLVMAGLGAALLSHAVVGCRVTVHELGHDYSQSARAGRFLARHHPDAVLICEPDYYAESLPYYAANPIYIVREDRLGAFVRFTRSANRTASLTEIVVAAERLRRESGETVLISLPEPIERIGPGTLPGSYGRSLSISRGEIDSFLRDYEPIAAFAGEGRETFVFYGRRAMPGGAAQGPPGRPALPGPSQARAPAGA